MPLMAERAAGGRRSALHWGQSMASVMPAGACTGTVPLSAVVLLDRTQVGNLWNRSIVLGRVLRAAVQHAPYLISFPKTRQWLSALLGRAHSTF